MRKVDDGEKKKEKMLFLVAINVVASQHPNADQLERCTLVPIISVQPDVDWPQTKLYF